MARIVVDPGHGGAATIPGDSTWNNAVGPNGTLEKNLTLDVGLRVDKILRDRGHDVRLTRNTDVNLRLRDRAKVARDLRAHAFVSIHFNGSTGHNAQGTETLVHTNFSQASAKLSLKVQDALLPVTGLTDRNRTFNAATRIKPQSLGVLRPDFHDPATAACLAEVSFLDRADQETKLGNQTYLQNIAKAIAAGLEAFTGAAVVAPPIPSPDVGDAIEVAAMAAGAADAETFLELASVPAKLQHSPEVGTADLTENAGKPAGLFSKAFVNNTGPALALIAGAPPWEHLGEFVTFIGNLGLAHFSPDEFLFLGASNAAGTCKGRNTFPPKPLWKNIKNTALMLDAIRKELGAPIRILSCYRGEAYNTCIGGESASLHMKFNAIDFTCSQGTPEIWRRVADRLRSSDAKFMGGIGVYPSSRFVHIDTRGSEANWSGS
jgi:N-acetylmuramoyl-L-alanine amidase